MTLVPPIRAPLRPPHGGVKRKASDDDCFTAIWHARRNWNWKGGGWGRLGDHLPPDFGKLVNPISTRGVDYTHHVTTRPPPPDFQNFLLPYTSSSCTVGNFLSPNLVEPEIKLIARQFDSIWLFQLVNNATVIHVGKWVQVKLFYSHIPSWCKKYVFQGSGMILRWSSIKLSLRMLSYRKNKYNR